MADSGTTTNGAETIPPKCLALLLLFWGEFVKKAKYPINDDVLPKAIELTKNHILNNCEDGKFDDAKNLKLAKRCIRKCARLCNEMAEDDDTFVITVEYYIEAFKKLQGVTSGPAPVSGTSTPSTAPAAPPRGKFHGLLCQDP